jgi:hypothetical protein
MVKTRLAQLRGDHRAGPVVVFASDHRLAQRPFRGVVVQGQLGKLAVAGQPFPFPAQGGERANNTNKIYPEKTRQPTAWYR